MQLFDLDREVFRELVNGLIELSNCSDNPRVVPPWQTPPEINGVHLFPVSNNSRALEFLFLLGALNYSYWINEGDSVSTWGVEIEDGRELLDVFALAYCIRRAEADGELKYDVNFYEQFDRADARRIFSSDSESCGLPLLESRVKKINELAVGLQDFARDFEATPGFASFCRNCENFRDFIKKLAKYFPYTYGDPFRKLSQLLYKMVADRQPDNLPPGVELETTDGWTDAVNFSDLGGLSAQPDYMLPLFALKSGLWNPDPEVVKFFSDNVELPMDHPVEREIRRKTVKTVELIVSELPDSAGFNAGWVDSVMWLTAVEGCFSCSCDECWFRRWCRARGEKPKRLEWHHHLTRTPYY